MIFAASEVLGNISKVQAKRDSLKLSSISVLTSTLKKNLLASQTVGAWHEPPFPLEARPISLIFKIIILMRHLLIPMIPVSFGVL